jgi:hypothetical protein
VLVEHAFERGAVELARDRCEDAADAQVAALHVAAQARHEIVGCRLDFLLEPGRTRAHIRVLTARHCIEHADVPACAGAAGELGCAQDRGFIRHVRVIRTIEREACTLRRTTDAAGCEHRQRRCVAAREAPQAAEAEFVATLDEELALLIEESLERAQVHDRGIDFRLAEVRIDGRAQRQGRRHLVLQVETDTRSRFALACEGIVRVDLAAIQIRLRRNVG